MRFMRCGYVVVTADDDNNSLNATLRRLRDDSVQYLYSGCNEIYSYKVLVLLIMSIGFMVFTCCMLVEQADAIETNKSKIARMKITLGQDEGEYDKVANNFNEMFGIGIFGQDGGVGGPGPSFHWFLPTKIRFPRDQVDKIMGYQFQESWYGEIYDEDKDNRDIESEIPAEPLQQMIEIVPLRKSTSIGNTTERIKMV